MGSGSSCSRGEAAADGRDGGKREGETGRLLLGIYNGAVLHPAADRAASQVSRSNWTPLMRRSTLWHT